jgi:pyruvate ferredoxin oxidoreductase gamma subunit
VSQLIEIRWHARAGQGAVTAAKLVAETALYEDRFMQAMPEYGPERTGAPLKAFTRISDEAIEVCNNIENPGIVVVLDATLLSSINVLDGMLPDGAVVVNSTESPAVMREILKAPDGVKVATVDASGIALATIKRDIPNTPIVGALIKVDPVVDLESVKGQLLKMFGAKFSQEMIDANLESVTRAYEEVLIDG